MIFEDFEISLVLLGQFQNFQTCTRAIYHNSLSQAYDCSLKQVLFYCLFVFKLKNMSISLAHLPFECHFVKLVLVLVPNTNTSDDCFWIFQWLTLLTVINYYTTILQTGDSSFKYFPELSKNNKTTVNTDTKCIREEF